MENGDHGSKVATGDEEDCEGKPAEECSLDGVGLERKLSRVLGDAIKYRVQLCQQTRNQGWVARKLPRQGFIDVGLSARSDDEIRQGSTR